MRELSQAPDVTVRGRRARALAQQPVPAKDAADTKQPRSWFFGSLPFAATALVFANALYIALVAIGNITDYDSNFAFVQHVLSMDTTNFGGQPGVGLDPDVMWRALTSPWMWHTGYVLIILTESVIACVLLVSTVKFVTGIRRGTYESARRWAIGGLTLMILLFAGGFIAIGGEWFQMWRSTSWNGLEAALRNTLIAGLALLVTAMPNEAWRRPRAV